MKKLVVPRTEMFVLAGREGNMELSRHWFQFFQTIVDRLRVQTQMEVSDGVEEKEGNWRLIQSGDDLVFQRLESGTWTTKSTISA